jgi:uroporphyrin-III C-methyltransferase / precorrin-2 dehydrogenase / sirohydrochlorin ferrochelatase
MTSNNAPVRLGALARLPLFFALDGKRAVVAGGSAAAAWKAELASAAGAIVEVYADDVSGEMLEVAREPPRGKIILQRRAWTAEDLPGAALAIGGFQNDENAAAFTGAARAAGVPVNIIDRADLSDFTFGAIVNRSPLVIGISTDGAAPVFARAIRGMLESLLPKEFAAWADAAARWRGAVKRAGLSFAGARKFWQMFAAHAVANPNSAPNQDHFDRFIAHANGKESLAERGSVTVIGGGAGDPELLTLRALRALQSADVILFDDRVSRDLFGFSRREARKILVGHDRGTAWRTPSEIDALIVDLARQGNHVVRLKGCDPLALAEASREADACRAANIPVEIVPGVSAAHAIGNQDVRLGSGPWRRLQAAARRATHAPLATSIQRRPRRVSV